MSVFSKRKQSSEITETMLNDAITDASQNPEKYANNPKDYKKKILKTLENAPVDYILSEKLKTEIDIVDEYLYYMIEIKTRVYDLPLYSEFVANIEKYREIAGAHGREQKEKIEQFRRDGFNGKKWICVSAHEEFINHKRTHEQISRLDEPFYLANNVKLMYPGDPDGPREETAGCLCYLEPVNIERIFH